MAQPEKNETPIGAHKPPKRVSKEGSMKGDHSAMYVEMNGHIVDGF